MLMTSSSYQVLGIAGVRKDYGDITALDGVSFSISAGETVGILGPNGAGKTTLLEIVCGYRSADTGAVEAFGELLEPNQPDVWEKMAIALPGFTLPARSRVSEIVELYKVLYSNRSNTQELLESVGLGDLGKRFPPKMSNGQKQRLTLLLALMASPDLLILDEPTSELDPHGRRMVWKAIEGFKAEGEGKSLLLATHQMDEAAALCDKVGILLRGKLAAFDTPEGLIATHCPGNKISIGVDPQIYDFSAARYIGGTRSGFIFTTEDLPRTLEDIFSKLPSEALASLQVTRPTLEDVFFAVTGEELSD